MKKLEFIAPIILATLLAACSKSTIKKDSCNTTKDSKHQKVQTFIAPPPQNQQTQQNLTDSNTESTRALPADKAQTIPDTNAQQEISKYAYYVITDSNQRQVRPELIEKYRRSRNNKTYINLYPTDWAGIMKDRGLKPAREKKQRIRKQRSRYYSNYSNNYYSNNHYRPRGWGLFPIFSYGWNSSTGWTPNLGVAVGPRAGWGPYGSATWGGRRRGMNYNAGMPMYYNNIYSHGSYGYPQRHIGNTYYNNVYNYHVPVDPTVQTNGSTNNQAVDNNAPQTLPVENKTNSSSNITKDGDWSDGVGGPERYTNKSKKIADYQPK